MTVVVHDCMAPVLPLDPEDPPLVAVAVLVVVVFVVVVVVVVVVEVDGPVTVAAPPPSGWVEPDDPEVPGPPPIDELELPPVPKLVVGPAAAPELLPEDFTLPVQAAAMPRAA